jgi:hypothetical protein
MIQAGEIFSNKDMQERIWKIHHVFKPSKDFKLTAEQHNINRRVLTLKDWEKHRQAFLFGAGLGFLVIDQEGYLPPPPPPPPPGEERKPGEKKKKKKKKKKEKEKKEEASADEGEKDVPPPPPPIPGEKVKWFNIAVMTGLCLHIDAELWMSRMPGATLLESLPPDLAGLFTSESGLVLMGVGIARDIEALGITGMRWIEAQYLYDGLIKRGALCHFLPSRPQSGVHAMQASMWGWEYVTKLFWSLQEWTESIFKNYPKEWERNGLPKYRKMINTMKWINSELTDHQWHYNAHDLFIIIALVYLKIVATLINNPSWQGGTIDKWLFDLVLEEEIGVEFKPYNKDPAANARSDPYWPQMPGATVDPAQGRPRRGPYLGADRAKMPEPNKPRFGSQDYEDLIRQQSMEATIDWDALRQQPGGLAGQYSSASATAPSSPSTSAAQTKTKKQLDDERKRRNFYDTYEIAYDQDEDEGEDDLARFDSPVESDNSDGEIRMRYMQPASMLPPDDEPPGPNVPDPTDPVREPFYRYVVPASMVNKTDEEKWAWIRQMRKGFRPAVPWRDSWKGSKSRNVNRCSDPGFKDLCRSCGSTYHSDVDLQGRCNPEELRCVYPPCPDKAKHCIKVCPSLQFGCRNCAMRGHYRANCPCPDRDSVPVADRTTVMAPGREQTRQIFETWADLGANTVRR